jgi:hypothetical protein
MRSVISTILFVGGVIVTLNYALSLFLLFANPNNAGVNDAMRAYPGVVTVEWAIFAKVLRSPWSTMQHDDVRVILALAAMGGGQDRPMRTADAVTVIDDGAVLVDHRDAATLAKEGFEPEHAPVCWAE